MSDVAEFIKRAARRTGLKREYYVERNIPTDPSLVLAVPFFGDIRSTFILSSLFLRPFREANRDKYIILCSWPGMHHLFPYVDEYWTIDDESAIKRLATSANNIYNSSSTAAEITRSLLEALNVFTVRDLKAFYDNGFTKTYWDTFGEIRRFLPEVPSSNFISSDFKSQLENHPGKKIVIYPATKMRSWQKGKSELLAVSKEFWIALIERLLGEGYAPVIYQNQFTYDVSVDFVERCIYLTSTDISGVLAAFRHIGCVLDVHTGISKLAIAARCPFVSVTERQIFVKDREYEVDDLCASNLPKQYIFSFSTQLMVGTSEEWEVSLLGNIVKRLEQFMPIDESQLPSTSTSYEPVSYEAVRQREAKRIGAAFISSSKKM